MVTYRKSDLYAHLIGAVFTVSVIVVAVSLIVLCASVFVTDEFAFLHASGRFTRKTRKRRGVGTMFCDVVGEL